MRLPHPVLFLELLLGREEVFLRTGWEGVRRLHASGPDPMMGQVVEGGGRIMGRGV